MEMRQIVEAVAQSSFVCENIAMSVQLGLPYLDKMGNRLCLRFLPHKQMLQGQQVLFFQPQYELVLVYPFTQVVRFSNLTATQNRPAPEPVCCVDKQFYLSEASYAITELYEACDRVLSFQEQDGSVSDSSIQRCQAAFWETVEALELIPVYTEE